MKAAQQERLEAILTEAPERLEADRDGAKLLAPMGCAVALRQFNFEGIQTTTENKAERVTGYTQLFRSGIIESVDARHSARNVPADFKHVLPPWPELRESITDGICRFLEGQRWLRLSPPIAVSVSLAGVRGHELHPGPAHFDQMNMSHFGRRIDRDNLILLPRAIRKFRCSSCRHNSAYL